MVPGNMKSITTCNHLNVLGLLVLRYKFLPSRFMQFLIYEEIFCFLQGCAIHMHVFHTDNFN